MAQDPNSKHDHGVRGYIIVALILAVITYVEFAIVEYEIPFLGDAFTLWTLIILSLVKFLMVIMYFMHLKGDHPAYSGFFASGMVLAMGTFIAFTFLMTVPASVNYVRSQLAPEGRYLGAGEGEEGGHGEAHLPEDVVALIESDGYSRGTDRILDAARPKDRSFRIEAPAAAEPSYTLASLDAAMEAPEGEGDAEAAADGENDAQATRWNETLGEETYASNCASCHQANGQGIPGAFPPLAGHTSDLATRDGGRTYLTHVLLYGLQGPIDVQGTTYDGAMPAWNQLDDEQLAATLNHTLYTLSDTTTPNDIPPITPNDIANQRDQNLTPQDQHDERETLLADTDEPEGDEPEGDEPAPEGEGDAEAAADGENDAQATRWNETLGEETYASNCASCHQANGQGIPGAFPPLAGHTSDLATRDGGRTYLTHVLLYGLQGPIDVQGTTYDGAMPAWNQLDDEQLAATLNHTLYTLSDTTTPNDIPPITPNDIANQRDQNLTPQDQHDEREELSLP